MLLAGIDEVGVGPLAGPLTAAGVVIEQDAVAGVQDSKRVSEHRRYELAEQIWKAAAFVCVTDVAPDFINQKGDADAWSLAIWGCVKDIRKRYPDVGILVDGRRLPPPARSVPQQIVMPEGVVAIVGGDATEYAISAASLVAKAHRDRQMIELGKTYPYFGFEQSKGYGTPYHVQALRQYGMTPEHRKKATAKIMRRKGLWV